MHKPRTPPPFRIQDLGEIAIRTSRMDEMFAFYRDVVGLQVLTEPSDGIAFFRIAAGYEGHTKVLALFEPTAGRPAVHPHGNTAPQGGVGSTLHHLALNIDFQAQPAAIAWLQSQGLEVVEQVFDWIGWRGVFFRDPDGNTVEFVAKDPSWLGPGKG